MSNAQADMPGAEPLASQQPLPSFRGLAAEELHVSPFCGSLDLHSRKRFARDDRDALGLGSVVVQDPLEPGNRFLRLDQHLSHIDQGDVLIGAAQKLAMGNVSGIFERVDVGLSEEPANGDRHQIERGSCGYSEARGHTYHLGLSAYEIVACNLKNLASAITVKRSAADVSAPRLSPAAAHSFVATGFRSPEVDLISCPTGKQVEIARAFGGGTVDRMARSSLRAAVGRHSALLLKWTNNQSQNLTSIYLDRPDVDLVPVQRTSLRDWPVSRARRTMAFTTQRRI
ncbi:hypothetical protein [Sphingomonas sp. NFX23]|uniref:hypothetical protein n=1 Tax=Sphingomonas sp. NFX23 TaxID=2819532 RepID=UPI003CF0916F